MLCISAMEMEIRGWSSLPSGPREKRREEREDEKKRDQEERRAKVEWRRGEREERTSE